MRKTARKIIMIAVCLLMTVVALFSMGCASFALAAESNGRAQGLTLEISSIENAAVGETVTVSVNASRVEAVAAITIMFRFDPTALELVEGLDEYGETVIGEIKPVLRFGSMELKLLNRESGTDNKFRLDATGITPWEKEGVILEMKFRVLDSKPTSIEILRDECIVANYDSEDIDFKFINGKINFGNTENINSAEDLDKFIEGLPENVGAGEKEIVGSLVDAYNKLSDEEKSKVQNIDSLNSDKDIVDSLPPIAGTQSSNEGNAGDGNNAGGNNLLWIIIGVAGAVVVIGAVVTVILVKKKSK